MLNLGNPATRSARFESRGSGTLVLPVDPSRMLLMTFCKNSDAFSPGSATANKSLRQLRGTFMFINSQKQTLLIMS
jgi:hypothetical protein